MTNFDELKATLPSGKEVLMSEYNDKVILIANTASKCGLTYQYEGLQELYDEFGKDGLIILGFPCNQFANQEPGNDEEIKQNCLINYGVSFPVFKKIDVNGENTHEIFKYLKQNSFSLFGSKIKWNFTKFLISKDRKKIKRFAPTTKPNKMKKEIINFLNQ